MLVPLYSPVAEPPRGLFLLNLLLMQKLTLLLLVLAVGLSSCVSKKQLEAAQADVASRDEIIAQRDQEINRYAQQLAECERKELQLENQMKVATERAQLREEQIEDLRKQRDAQLEQVGDLTVLSQGANQNIGNTLRQLEGKDRYIRLLQ